MSGSQVTVQHQLGKDEALRRIKGMLGDLQNSGGGRISDLQEQWTDQGGSFSFTTAGFKVSGSLDVTDTEVKIDVNYPLAARPFKGKIESALRERTQDLLAA